MYKTLSGAGKMSIIVGIVTMVISIACGVLSIVAGAKILRKKKEILF